MFALNYNLDQIQSLKKKNAFLYQISGAYLKFFILTKPCMVVNS